MPEEPNNYKLAVSKVKARFGEDHYQRIGALGGKAAKKPKGFATMDKERLSEIGRRAGSSKRRRKADK